MKFLSIHSNFGLEVIGFRTRNSQPTTHRRGGQRDFDLNKSVHSSKFPLQNLTPEKSGEQLMNDPKATQIYKLTILESNYTVPNRTPL